MMMSRSLRTLTIKSEGSLIGRLFGVPRAGSIILSVLLVMIPHSDHHPMREGGAHCRALSCGQCLSVPSFCVSEPTRGQPRLARLDARLGDRTEAERGQVKSWHPNWHRTR